MKNFILGILLTLVVVPLVAFICLRMGLPRFDANAKPASSEANLAMAFLDASIDRHAEPRRDPFPPTPEVLMDGMKMYRQNCAMCHGGPRNPASQVTLYPPAPQFMKEAPDMPEYKNFYVTKNGVRYTAMPAWSSAFSDDQIWKIVTFLSNMDRLPPEVRAAWTSAEP